MKKFLYAAAAAFAAVSAISSCSNLSTEEARVQDEPSVTVELVPMTFTGSVGLDDADADTKTVLDGLSIEWKSGDRIAVFDDVSPDDPQEFTVVSDGATSSFTGSVHAGATKFFAVYPYSAAESYVAPGDGDTFAGKLIVNIPDVQAPVVGSFDPDACVLVAYTDSEDNALRFRIPFALAKFSVDYDDVVSVSLSSGNSMSGSIAVTMNSSSNISVVNGDGTVSKSVTVRNDDLSPLQKGAVYYAVLRASSSHTGFTATVGNTDGSYASRTAASAVAISRKSIKGLGTFSGLTFTPNLYQAYQDGLDVSIAGKTYNKSAYGDAVELSSTAISSSTLTAGKLHFLKAGTTYTMSGSRNIDGEVVIAGENPDDRATISMSGQFRTVSGSLAIANVNIDASGLTSSALMSNFEATASFDRLAFSNCAITAEGSATSLWAANSSYLGYALKEAYFNGNLLRTSGTLVALLSPNKGNTAFNALAAFTFTNNVMYSSTGSNVKMQLANFTGSTPTSGWTTALKVDNNIFYNTTTSSGLFRSYDLGSVDISNNIFYASDGTEPGGNAKVIFLSVSDGSSFAANTACSGNYAYGSLLKDGSAVSWTVADSKFRVGNLANPEVLSESPIATADVSAGTFALTSAYSGYGPQPIPAP